jgi:hypothetical protein
MGESLLDEANSLGIVRRQFVDRLRRSGLILLVGLSAVFCLYEFAPLYSQDPVYDVQNSREYRQFSNDLTKAAADSKRTEVNVFASDLSFFVAFSAVLEVAPEAAAGPHSSSKVRIRADHIILSFGLIVVMIISYLPIYTGSSLGNDNATKSTDPWFRTPASAIEIFKNDVLAASRRSQVIFSRSTLLLSCGVVIAFVGVAIFYVTLPDAAHAGTVVSSSFNSWPTVSTHRSYEVSTDVWAYLRSAIRPTGVLIFLEAIAWFLLRQYRAFVEDYKWFHRVYIKRVNYLAAGELLKRSVVSKENFFLATALIREDFSERLREGETTESLEKLKMPEDGLVKEILAVIEASFRKSAKHTKNVAVDAIG